MEVHTYHDVVVMPTTNTNGKKPWMGGAYAQGELITESLLPRTEGKFLLEPKPLSEPEESIDREVIFAGYSNHHFGHFLTESLARLWYALENPDLPVLWNGLIDIQPWQREILDVINIKNPCTYVRKPVRVKKLLVPQAGCILSGGRLHPHHKNAIATFPCDEEPKGKTWLSRSNLSNALGGWVNERNLEVQLEKQGWNIYHPQEHSIADQIKTLASSMRIAGIEGSAFYTLLLLNEPRAQIDMFNRGCDTDPTFVNVAEVCGWNITFHSVPRNVLSHSPKPRRFKADRLFYCLVHDTKEVAMALGEPLPTPPPAKPSLGFSEIINDIISTFGYARYLEVGVAHGRTFKNVRCGHKTGVDPSWVFDARALGPDDRFYRVTSDEFFTHDLPDGQYDLIHLDGLHQFEQTWRDLLNSMECSHDKTIWIIDDVLPPDQISAHRSKKESLALRNWISGKKSGAWHGDVYKMIYAVHDCLPKFSYCIITDRGNAKMFVWRESRRPFAPIFDSLADIARMKFEQHQDMSSYWNVTTYETAISCIKKAFEGDDPIRLPDSVRFAVEGDS